MSGEIFANKYKVVPGQVSVEDILVDATYYPASGAYIDVSGCERVHVLVRFGAINGGTTATIEIKQAEALDGTPDVIDATHCKQTVANTADDTMYLFTIETDKLATDHHFVTLEVNGTIASDNYAEILFFLPLASEPVTQTAALCPAANQLAYVG